MKHLLLAGLCLAVLFAGLHAVDTGLLHAIGGASHHLAPFSAMGLMPMRSELKRGVAFVRSEADASAEIRNLIADLDRKLNAKFEAQNKAWVDFQAANNVAKDGLDGEAVKKINAALTDYGTEMDRINAQLAALRIGGIGNNVAGGPLASSITPEQKAYRAAFSGMGGYLRKGRNEDDLPELAAKAGLGVNASLSADSNPDGGYTVTPELDNAISRIQQNVCAMRSISQVLVIGSASYKKNISQGGALSGWVDQRQTRTTTGTPKLDQLTFTARELYAEPVASQGLLDDASVDIEAWLANEVAITFNEQEGLAFISGVDGAAQPFGFLSYGNVADASYAWGKLGYYGTGNATGFATSNPGDAMVTLCYGLKQSYRVNATWICNRGTQGTIRTFKDQQNNYLWQPGFTAGQPATILGYPVADDDNMPALGSAALPVAFGDFKRGYLIVDRVGVRVLRDNLTVKGNILFYTTKRVGGGVQNFEAIKLLKCA